MPSAYQLDNEQGGMRDLYSDTERFNIRDDHFGHDGSGDRNQLGPYKYEFTKEEYDIVAAIDFGTSTTGCAYTTKSMFKKNPLDFNCEQICNELGHVNQEMAKTKTCLLYKKEGECISFGYDAEYKYTDYRTKNEHEEYRFFHNFKMKLYNSRIPLSKLMIYDVSGRTQFSAKKLFSDAISTLTKKIIDMIEKTEKYTVKQGQIRWVLTVPAIWSDDAKYFMRECACQAGIPGNQILIALEPEAASIYCNYLRVERSNTDPKGFVGFPPGTKYMVVDIGGGTTDITVHEKQEDGTLMEINKAFGDGIGGVSVDKDLVNLVRDKLKHDVISKLKYDKPNIYLDLYYDIERAKRSIDMSTSDTVPIKINYTVIDKIFKKYFKSSLSNISEIEDEDLLLDAKDVMDILRSTASSVLKVIKDSIESVQLNEISIIIMVGGFANSEIIRDTIEKSFPHTRVIVPDNAGLAVLFGAVIFGHDKWVISHRFTRKTYGIGIQEQFDEKKYLLRNRVIYNGISYCKNIFGLIIRQNQKVTPGTRITKNYWVVPHVNITAIEVYTSSKDLPEYVDDPTCSKIGSLQLKYPRSLPIARDIEVTYIFGDTELFITARDKTSNIKVDTRIILD